MTIVQLLDELHRRRVLLSLDGRRLVVTPPPAGIPDDLVAPITMHKIDLAWAAAGAVTGHAWAACDTCAEPMLVRLTSSRHDRPCVITPGCTGRIRHATPPTRRRRAAA